MESVHKVNEFSRKHVFSFISYILPTHAPYIIKTIARDTDR